MIGSSKRDSKSDSVVPNVFLHVDAHEERADKVIASPLPLLNAIELLVGRMMAHVTDTA